LSTEHRDIDRRSFIKLTAVTATSAALASCGNPENELIRFVPDEDIVPGVAVWKPSVCPLCASGCGLTVRVMEADAEVVRGGQAGRVRINAAKKLEGSPAHPVNHGGLCPRGHRLAFLKRPTSSHRTVLIEQFLARYGAPRPVTYELFDNDVLRRANAFSFGREQLPTFDLPNARYVLGFGADFLGTWNSPVSQGRGYGAMRQGRPGIRGTFVQVESRMSQTGANADEWVPVRPGTEGVLALGLANVIMAAKLRPAEAGGRAGSLIEGWSTGLVAYTPEQVEKLTGVAARRVDRLARELAERRPSVAIIGGSPLAHTNGLFNALAVNALNALMGSVEQPGGMFFTPQIDLARTFRLPPSRPERHLERLAADILSDTDASPHVLLVDGANPVFATPRAWRVREAFQKIPYIASFGSFLDETSGLADLILPDHSFLESWAESVPESGAMVAVVGAAPPVMQPLHQTRATGDVLLAIGRGLRRPLELPWQAFDELLAATFAALPAPSADTDAWTEAQEKGGWWGTLPAGLVTPAPAVTAGTPPATFVEPQFDGDTQQFPFHFLPYASSAFLDGSLSHLPWLQEMPDPLTSAMWSSWVEINPTTAEGLGIGQGDVVEVTSAHGTVRTAAVVSPGIAPDVVAMPVGQGHRTFTRYASGRGENPIELLASISETATGALAWAATRVRVSRIGGPDGRLVLFAGGLREHEERGR
jgi:menaquinone reductase, molybdopterin-binding-like subunit